MSENKLSIKNIIIVGGAGLAFSIGSGFATGQEVLQYFAAYGLMGILAMVLFASLNIYANWQFIEAGHVMQLSKGNEVYRYFCGKYLGTAFDWFACLFCFMSFVVMVAGAGATLNQQYGIPEIPGAIVIAVLTGITVMFGLNKMVDVLGFIGPVVVVMAIVVAVLGIAKGGTDISAALDMLKSGEIETLKAGSNWLTSAYSYLGFGMLWFAGFYAAIGKEQRNPLDAKFGAVLHSTMLGLAILVIMFSLWANMVLVVDNEAQVPLLMILNNVSGPLASIFAIIIFLGIYSTACPLLWTPCNSLAKEGTAKYRILTAVLTVAGCFIGLALPFDILMNYIYTINGYIGGFMLVFIIIKHIRVVYAKKKGQASAE